MKISIRWRLALSFAALVLLVTLALGVVLMNILRGYYEQQELAYLRSNADALSMMMADIAQGNPSSAILQSQVEGLTFLAQSRVRVLDVDENVIADSGSPQDVNTVIISRAGEGEHIISIQRRKIFTSAKMHGEVSLLDPNVVVVSSPFPDNGEALDLDAQSLPVTASLLISDVLFSEAYPLTDGTTIGAFSAVQTLYGLDFGADGTYIGARTSTSVRQPIMLDGAVWGYIELSEGPAYGTQIADSAANAWAVSGLVAVPLAAVVGWLLSRNISAPIIALTDVTARMAEGDLQTRAPITKRKDEVGMLAHAFNQMAARVEDTVITLRQFASDAAHELHTPLTALRTNLELAGDSDDTESSTDAIARAQAQVARLEALTAGLLDLSHIEAGAPTFAPVDVAALAREMSEIYASQAEQAGITFSTDIPAEVATVQGDAAQLRRVLTNLLDNALKFTPEGDTVELSLKTTPKQVCLVVQDTGIGIPDADLPHLFQRFHRGRNAATYPGNGLGLAIVRAIADAHNGLVVAKNTQHGACFTLCLPAAFDEF